MRRRLLGLVMAGLGAAAALADAPDPMHRALDLYCEGRFLEAAELLERLMGGLDSSRPDYQLGFLRGVALRDAEREEAAVAQLERTLASLEGTTTPRELFYLGRSELVLAKLAARQGSARGEEARRRYRAAAAALEELQGIADPTAVEVEYRQHLALHTLRAARDIAIGTGEKSFYTEARGRWLPAFFPTAATWEAARRSSEKLSARIAALREASGVCGHLERRAPPPDLGDLFDLDGDGIPDAEAEESSPYPDDPIFDEPCGFAGCDEDW